MSDCYVFWGAVSVCMRVRVHNNTYVELQGNLENNVLGDTDACQHSTDNERMRWVLAEICMQVCVLLST